MPFNDIYTLQSIALYGFPTILFMVIFFVGLGYSRFHTHTSEQRMDKIIHEHPEGIRERNAPFPLVLFLIITGTVLWGIFYIMAYGLWNVRI